MIGSWKNNTDGNVTCDFGVEDRAGGNLRRVQMVGKASSDDCHGPGPGDDFKRELRGTIPVVLCLARMCGESLRHREPSGGAETVATAGALG